MSKRPTNRKRSRHSRKRIGKVSYYQHHGSWHVYYRENGKQIRKKVAATETEAEQIAARINAQLSSSLSTYFSFVPITVGELRQKFLDHHENVLRSSLQTIRRYRAATKHIEDYTASNSGSSAAHAINPEDFAHFLRNKRVSPNGHANTVQRPLRDKGVKYILQVCRTMFAFARKKRFLPPYSENPFSELPIDRLRVRDAKPIFVFDEMTELKFWEHADAWSFPIHFTQSKTGTRSGELCHLLVEDLDLKNGWIHIRNKTELGWTIKTGRERSIPLCDELILVLNRVVGERTAGPVFLRPRFHHESPALASASHEKMIGVSEERTRRAESERGRNLSREEVAKIQRKVWRDVGALKPDEIRKSFMKITHRCGMLQVTCPKSWRHTFATLLQDAEVDPLIRQITLGHQTSDASKGALGMTGSYTHTRPETLKKQILAALRLWPHSLEFARNWTNTTR